MFFVPDDFFGFVDGVEAKASIRPSVLS